MRARVLTCLYALALAAIIVAADAGLGRPIFQMIESVPGGDKTGHFLLMGTLALLTNLSLGARRVCWGGRGWLVGSAVVFALATGEELSQAFFRSRHCDAADWLADVAGVLVLGRLALIARIEKPRG